MQEIELGPRAAAGARAALKRLEQDVPSDVLEDLRLLVSELVTNSFRHGGAGQGATATLTVDVDPERIHVDVEDRGRGFVPSVAGDAPRDRASGWGLTIVDKVADRWGVTGDGSTNVWFELVTQSRGMPARSA
jgi:anti-sigma regulatory factor (Ser/Thr protein kinase)